MKRDSIIFDLDGTLWNASETVVRAFNDSIQAIGFDINLTSQTVRDFSGMKMDDIFTQYFSFVPKEKLEEFETIYANKENTETELINKDRLNQQAVANQNITNYNTWKEKKNAFENAIIEKQSENTIGLINSINAGVQNAIGNFEKRLAAENNIRAIAAANPNVNPIILKALGVRGITNDMIESWLRAYGNKNN